MRKLLATAACAAVLISSAAWATVTFDESTGTGFVGKGDVQLALGLNNAKMQAQASTLQFKFEQQGRYSVTCSYEDFVNVDDPEGPGKIKEYFTAEKDFNRVLNINSSVQYDARTHKQVDGFLLTGYSNNNDPRDLSCPSDGRQYTFESATEVEVTGGGLTVNGVALIY
jgi:opacity protein-like surface antigen